MRRVETASTIDASGVLTYAEAARELGVSRQRVAQLADRGTLSVIRLRGRRYVGHRSVINEAARREAEGKLLRGAG